MIKLARVITPDEVAAFELSGVVLLRGVLDLAAVNGLRRSIDDATETLHESPAGYDLSALTKAAEAEDDAAIASADGGQYDLTGIADFIKASGQPILVDRSSEATGSFILDTGVSKRNAGLRQICLKGAVPEIAAALLRSEVVTFLGDQIFVKEPQTREKTAYHQDAPYFEIEGEQCCVMWIPVDPVTPKNGGMSYVRGSHRGKTMYAPNLFVTRARMPGSEGDLLPDIDADPDAYDIIRFEAEPGDIIVHHYKTIHGSGGNLSRYQVRRAASLRYCGDDIRFKTRPGVPPQLHHTRRLADGDKLGGPDFPVVWRRPAAAAVA